MKPNPTVSAQEPVRGAIDLTIGQTDGDDRYTLGQVLGLALDARGRIYVSDMQAGSIHTYGPTGDFRLRIGRTGGGPLEYRLYPTDIAILPDGGLWIVSDGDKVLRADTARDDVAKTLEEMPVQGSRSWLVAGPVALDEEGRLVVTGREPVQRDSLRRRRVSLRTGSTISKTNPWALWPTWEELGWRLPRMSRTQVAELEAVGGLAWAYTNAGAPPPYGSNWLMAFASDGRVAGALTTTYRVSVYDSLLRPVSTIAQDEEGPRLTAAERRSTLAHMAERRRQSRYYVYGENDIPERKPPIRNLWFDRDGRLWVERHLPHLPNEPQEQGADVYGTNGEHLFSATWPRGVDFGLGAIRSSTGLGIQTDVLGIERVVRVRFGPDSTG